MVTIAIPAPVAVVIPAPPIMSALLALHERIDERLYTFHAGGDVVFSTPYAQFGVPPPLDMEAYIAGLPHHVMHFAHPPVHTVSAVMRMAGACVGWAVTAQTVVRM